MARVHPAAGMFPAISYMREINMRTLSIFVDESGDFGAFEPHCPYYIFSLVFHDQEQPIEEQTTALEDRLFYLKLPREHCFHAMPIIRKEEDYHELPLETRRKLLGYLFSYFRSLPIQYTSFIYKKKEGDTVVDINLELSRQLSYFITNNWNLFSSFDNVIVYYDNGQIELTKVLSSVLGSLLPHVEFRKVEPVNYRLFQIADLCCTFDLIDLKHTNGMLSKSETIFFGDNKSLRKNYLKPIKNKKL